MLNFEGGCHCGNLAFLFAASRPLEDLGLRACMCSFCRAHGARTTSDPKGEIRIKVRTAERLVRYRFGQRTSDFLLCASCGVYIGALLPEGERSWFTVNVNTLQKPPPLQFPVEPIKYDGEDFAERLRRRREKWTPVLSFGV